MHVLVYVHEHEYVGVCVLLCAKGGAPSPHVLLLATCSLMVCVCCVSVLFTSCACPVSDSDNSQHFPPDESFLPGTKAFHVTMVGVYDYCMFLCAHHVSWEHCSVTDFYGLDRLFSSRPPRPPKRSMRLPYCPTTVTQPSGYIYRIRRCVYGWRYDCMLGYVYVYVYIYTCIDHSSNSNCSSVGYGAEWGRYGGGGCGGGRGCRT